VLRGTGCNASNVADDEGAPSRRRRRRDSLTSRVFTAADQESVPLRTIVTTVLVVVGTGLLLLLAWALRLELVLFLVAIFLTVVLAGPVAFLERHGLRWGVATTLVFFVALLAFGGLAYLFGQPLVSHIATFAHELPKLTRKAEEGKGWVGRLATRLHLRNWITRNAPKLKQFAEKLAKPAFSLGAAAFTTLVAIVTTAMLAYFLLLDLPKLWSGLLSVLPEQRAARVARVAHEAATGVTGYVAGNVATSIIAGVVVFVSLLSFGVPFAGLLGLFVAFVDLLPIVGGLLAGIPVFVVATLHSLPTGIAVAVIFLVYTQIENHVLNPIIMSRTVKMSKLLILITVVLFAALGDKVAGVFGTFIGALIGIPLGSAIQVVVRELRHPHVTDPVADRTAPDS
jgi:predicted PurR-regulated permease PerM